MKPQSRQKKMKTNLIKMVNSTLLSSISPPFHSPGAFEVKSKCLLQLQYAYVFLCSLRLAFNRKWTNYKVKWINVCIEAHKAKKMQWINNITFTFIQFTVSLSLWIQRSADSDTISQSFWHHIEECVCVCILTLFVFVCIPIIIIFWCTVNSMNEFLTVVKSKLCA